MIYNNQPQHEKNTEDEVNNTDHLVTMQWFTGNPAHTTHPNIVAAQGQLTVGSAAVMRRLATVGLWVVCQGVAST